LRMKKILIAIISFLLLFLLSPSNIWAQSTFTISAPDSNAFYGPFLGFGAEWDPFFWNVYNQKQGLNQADWDLITSRMKEMNIPIVRMWTQLYFATFDPDNQVWNWNGGRMQSLFKHLDFACKNNVDVLLTDWGWSFWQNYQGNPTDPRFAQGIAAFLKELVVNRGYSCIKYFNIVNEPDYESYFTNIPANFPNYVTMITNIDSALTANGLQDKVKFIGPDEACCGSYFVPTIESALHSVYDGYSFHIYHDPSLIANGSLWWRIEQYRDYVKNYSPAPNSDIDKIQILAEAGTTNGVSNNFYHAMSMADYGTTALNTRVQAVIGWNMYDIYYDQGRSEWDNNQMIPWGMWEYKDTGWALRPWSQTWGLLTKFAPRGSIRAAVKYPNNTNSTPPDQPLGTLRVAALKRPNGLWSIFAVNRNSSNTSVSVNLPGTITHSFDKYVVDSTSLAKYPNQVIVPAIGTVEASNSPALTLPANSFTVLVEQSGSPTPTSTPTAIPTNSPIPSLTPIPLCTPSDTRFCPPIAEWKFDEGSGTTANDTSGNGNTATLKGSGTGWGTGKYGKALNLNGSNGSYVLVNNQIMPSKKYTKSAWVYWNGGSDSSIIASGLGNVNHEFGVVSEFGGNCSGVTKKLASGHNGAYCSVVDPSTFPTNTWVYTAVTYDSSLTNGTMILYKNGSIVSTATNVAPITDDPFVNVGAWGWWSVWNGMIDQARIYDYALSSGQILTDMNYTSPWPTHPPTTPMPTGTNLAGDINGDGIVNILDYTLLSNAFGTNNSSADLNKDGIVNILDYTILSNNFGKSV